MANKINVKLILQLRDADMSRNTIASSRHMSRHSVSDVFRIADSLGVSYTDISDLDENEVYRMFYPDKHAVEIMFRDPDYEYVHQELRKKGVTLKLLWQEYKEQCRDAGDIPMGYTKYCDGYAQFTISNRLTNHLDHKPGAVAEVDWAGAKMHYLDVGTGEYIPVYLFVGVLPYSQYAYVEPCPDMKMDTFLRCHVRMYEFFGGVPVRTVCDNLKTGVVSHPRNGEIILTNDYEALGNHYMTAIMPTGVRKPKQKASVEGTVGKITTSIVAALRNREFTSFAELRKAVAYRLDAFNRKPFQKRDGCRYDGWLEEKLFLHPLPAFPFETARWYRDRSVNIDYHVVYNKNRYSCPYQYAGRKVDLRVTDTTLEIYYKGERVTTHNLFGPNVRNQYSTHKEDMPEAFRRTQPWDDNRIRNWAHSIGRYTGIVIDRIFESVGIKEQGYNPALSVLKLSRTYSDARLEAACELAITRGVKSPRYHHLSAILSANQDRTEVSADHSTAVSGYLRGSEFYENGGHDDDEQ